MNWDAVGAIGEIAGALVVVLTLLALMRQIKDNTRQLVLNSSTEANKLYGDAFDPIYNSRENLHIWIQGHKDPSELTYEELETFNLFMTRLMAAFDTVVEHYEHGAVTEETMTNFAAFTRQFLGSPGGQLWSARGQYTFSKAAKAIIDDDTVAV